MVSGMHVWAAGRWEGVVGGMCVCMGGGQVGRQHACVGGRRVQWDGVHSGWCGCIVDSVGAWWVACVHAFMGGWVGMEWKQKNDYITMSHDLLSCMH